MPKKHSGISKDKNGTWMIHTRVSLPNGETVTLTKRGFDTEGLAFEALELYKRTRYEEYIASKRPLKWLDATNEYWKYYSSKVKETTAKNAFSTFRKHCVIPFKDLKVSQVVKSATLRKFKENVQNSNVHDGTHKNRILKFMKACIQYHYERGNVLPDEFRTANIELEPFYAGSDVKEERPIWSKDEFQTFLNSFSKNDKYYILFEVMGHTGCRIGEIRGLQVKHYDYSKKDLFICQQAVSRLGESHWKIVSPKTKMSIRHIALSDRINILLSSYIKEMGYKDDDFIFFGKKPASETSINRSLSIHIKESGVKKISAHCLRHSNTTWLLSNPSLSVADIAMVSRRLGHESKKITLDIYYHLQNDSKSTVLLDALI